ncbi:hypothetical protein IW147_003127 [Coemansia sp. RSA 720]|nr:hypothetical protein IW147_003127 [Coemansia sp. RSA 720]
MFTFAIKHMEWVHKYVEKTRNTVKDDKAKLDAAAKAVDELVFPPLPVPYQRQLVNCPIEPLASKGDSISHMCLKYPEKHPLDTNMNAYPAHTGDTEQKLHNSSLIPKTQTLKRVCDNNGEDIKIAKRPRTRQQAKLICNSNIPINMLTDWQQISSKVVLGKILGSGRSGTVYSGIVNRRTVAVKVSKANADAVILNELHNEVNVYQHLANLQGDVIPRLYGHGLLEVDGTLRAALILEEINDWAGKTYPHEDRAEQLSLSVRQSAMNALDKIHACGVIHGDFRMNNVLFERTDSSDLPLKVRFVDLAFAEIGARKCALQLDHAGWGRVLNLPGF